MKREIVLQHLTDPEFFQENRLAPVSDHFWYETEAEALVGMTRRLLGLIRSRGNRILPVVMWGIVKTAIRRRFLILQRRCGKGKIRLPWKCIGFPAEAGWRIFSLDGTGQKRQKFPGSFMTDGSGWNPWQRRKVSCPGRNGFL